MLCNFLNTTQGLLLTLFVIALGLLYKFNNKKFQYWAERGVKFPKPSFILGHAAIRRTKSLLERLSELYLQFPDDRYVGLYQTYKPILLIRDLELIKRITIKDFESFSARRTFIDPEINKIWSKNLFSLNGEKWRDMRSTLSPSFTGSKMKGMFVLMQECAQQFVDFFKNRQDDLQELEMKNIFSKYTNDVIATTAFGIKCDSLKDEDNIFYRMGSKATSFGFLTLLRIILYALSPFLARLANIRLIPKDVEEYFTAIIKDTVKARREQQIIRPDMIHLLLEAQRSREDQKHKTKITIDDIVAQAFVFFFAGFDTVSTFLTFALYELAMNPQIQSKLRLEILAAQDEDGDEITYEKLLAMEYMDMVVSESLRKWPPMGVLDRRVTKSTTIAAERPWEKPLVLDEGVVCMVPVLAIQRDEKNFPEPDKFDPERFSSERKHEIDPLAYLPFGAGPRNCIGMRYALLEGKLLIFRLLKEFEVVPVERTNVPMVLDKTKLAVTAKGGMWLGFKKIKGNE